MEKEKCLTVVKSNKLIEASYKLTLAEQRLILACLRQIESKTTAYTSRSLFKVTAKEYAELFKIPKNQAYNQLKEAQDNLFEQKIVIRSPDKKLGVRFRWISKASYNENEGSVDIRFSTDILPYLSQISGNFTQYSLENISKLSVQYRWGYSYRK